MCVHAYVFSSYHIWHICISRGEDLHKDKVIYLYVGGGVLTPYPRRKEVIPGMPCNPIWPCLPGFPIPGGPAGPFKSDVNSSSLSRKHTQSMCNGQWTRYNIEEINIWIYINILHSVNILIYDKCMWYCWNKI